jgi:pimeloyl-ACP methyl ester carboxylesterase
MSVLGTVVASLVLSVSNPNAASASADLTIYAQAQTRVALPDGRRLNFYCTGRGAPTVILEGGWTATTVSWRKVQPALSAVTRVCSYDRAGYGFSDPGPNPRTAQALADDLAGLLKAAKIEGPYIIVAHSLGGLDARLFVDQHRQRVAGLVLVDPSNEYQDRDAAKLSPTAGKAEARFELSFKACAGAVIAGRAVKDLPQPAVCIDPANPSLPTTVNAARLAWESTAVYQKAALSELVSMGVASSDQVARSRRPWGDLPVIVFTAENTQKDPALSKMDQNALSKLWWSGHERVARLSTHGENRLLRDTGHLVPYERPEAVIDGVTRLVEQERSRATGN